jgi:hypothetical protein
MAPPYSGPSADDISDALTAVITHGLRPYHVAEHGGVLLKLRLVEQRLHLEHAKNGDERDAAYAEALTDVLREAVEQQMGRHAKYRRLLEHLLPLKPELLDESLADRRGSGGRAMTEGKKVVLAGTVRTYHQPKALAILADVLVRMEAEDRGEEASNEDRIVSPTKPASQNQA